MTQFSDALLFGMTIRESATDGSDFTNPAADYRRLFLGEDGLLHLKDSAGTVTTPSVPSGAVTTSGLTMATARLLGRTTASTGAIEEITVGSGLSLAAGALTATGSAAFVGVLANRSTDQTIATGGAVVSFNAADTYDTDAFHDPGGANPSRLVVPSGKDGKYVITGYLIWSAAAYGAGTIKQARIYKNGVGTAWAQTNDGNAAYFAQQVVTTPPLDLVATDYIELFAAHDRGTDGTVSGSVAAIKLGMFKVG